MEYDADIKYFGKIKFLASRPEQQYKTNRRMRMHNNSMALRKKTTKT